MWEGTREGGREGSVHRERTHAPPLWSSAEEQEMAALDVAPHLSLSSGPKEGAHEARGPMQARFNPYDYNGGCAHSLSQRVQKLPGAVRARPGLTATCLHLCSAARCSPLPARTLPLSQATRA